MMALMQSNLRALNGGQVVGNPVLGYNAPEGAPAADWHTGIIHDLANRADAYPAYRPCRGVKGVQSVNSVQSVQGVQSVQSRQAQGQWSGEQERERDNNINRD
jgi:hypothetical protein